LAQQNLSELNTFGYSDFSVKDFLTFSRTWQNAPEAWNELVAAENKLSLYASDSLFEAVHKCTNEESQVASYAKVGYDNTLRLSANNPTEATGVAHAANAQVQLWIRRANSICGVIRARMRTEIGVGS